jgi:hypothetical protein
MVPASSRRIAAGAERGGPLHTGDRCGMMDQGASTKLPMFTVAGATPSSRIV